VCSAFQIDFKVEKFLGDKHQTIFEALFLFILILPSQNIHFLFFGSMNKIQIEQKVKNAFCLCQQQRLNELKK